MSDDKPFIIACRACWWQEMEYGVVWLQHLHIERCPRCRGKLVVLNWFADGDGPSVPPIAATQPPLLMLVQEATP